MNPARRKADLRRQREMDARPKVLDRPAPDFGARGARTHDAARQPGAVAAADAAPLPVAGWSARAVAIHEAARAPPPPPPPESSTTASSSMEEAPSL